VSDLGSYATEEHSKSLGIDLDRWQALPDTVRLEGFPWNPFRPRRIAMFLCHLPATRCRIDGKVLKKKRATRRFCYICIYFKTPKVVV
jgi:hypothetical protein